MSPDASAGDALLQVIGWCWLTWRLAGIAVWLTEKAKHRA